MAETPSQPPGWPFNEGLPDIPPPAPPPGPTYEPPSTYEPAPPPGPTYEPRSTYEPAPPPGPTNEPPSTYQPPAPPSPPLPRSQLPPPGAQPPPPAPGSQLPPPPPPRRKGKSASRTIFIVLAVLAIPIGACSVWLVSVTKPPVDESNRFLAVVDQGDYQAAAAMTSCGLSAIELDGIFRGQDIEYNLTSSNVSSSRNTTNGETVSDVTTATVSGSIEVPNTSFREISLTLTKSGDNWTVCTLSVN